MPLSTGGKGFTATREPIDTLVRWRKPKPQRSKDLPADVPKDPEERRRAILAAREERDRLGKEADKIETEQAELWLFYAIVMTVATISFLHCKNVRLVDPVTTRAQRRRLAKQHLGDVAKVIEVKPMRSKGRPTDPSDSEWRQPTRLHLVRGHFKTWTEEAPLFGRLVGTWWCEPHSRGDADVGAVRKAYQPQT